MPPFDETSRDNSPPQPEAPTEDRAPGKRTRVESVVHRKAAAPGTVESAVASQVVSSAQKASSGGPLEPSVREPMEQRLNHDFSGVRVHTDGAAANAAQDLNAKAFTVGQDVYFNQGAYAPESGAGQKLLAHELTHVMQGAGGAAQSADGEMSVSDPSDPAEKAADEAAEKAVAGEEVPDVGAAPESAVHRDKFSDIDDLSKKGNVDEDELLKRLGALSEAEKRRVATEERFRPMLKRATHAFNAKEMVRMFQAIPYFSLDWKMYLLMEAKVVDDLNGAQWRTVLGKLTEADRKLLQKYAEGWQAFLKNAPYDLVVEDADDADAIFRTVNAYKGAEKQREFWRWISNGLRVYTAARLARANTLGDANHDLLKVMFDATPDGEVSVLQDLLRCRFRVVFRASTSKDKGKKPVKWEAKGLRRCWTALAGLPPGHVEGNDALDFMERYDKKDAPGSVGGVYTGGNDTVGLDYDSDNLGYKNQGGDEDVKRIDGKKKDDPLLGANYFDQSVRHEVGHSVDKKFGHRGVINIGNVKGGNWKAEDKSTIAATMVNASAGVISKWGKEEQKKAICDALQAAVDAADGGASVDSKIDGIAGLSGDDKKKVKGDNAVKQLKLSFMKKSPWYNAANGGISLGGRIYQEAYEDDWWSYQTDTRIKKVSQYQFRAPGEHFAEAYTTYYDPSAAKGVKLAAVDPEMKKYFDDHVDPVGIAKANPIMKPDDA